MKVGAARVRWFACWLVAGQLAAAACASSPEAQFYTLYPRGGSVRESEPFEVELRRPGLPSYLDRPQIVRHSRPGKLELSDVERWAAPLEDMVGSILAENLAQRLPSARVFTESGAISASPDALIEIEIQRFELSEHGKVELIAQVAVHWPKTTAPDRLERYALSGSPQNGSTEELVMQMSGLLADLATSIAAALHDRPPPAAAAPPDGAAPPEEAGDSSAPPSPTSR